MATKTVLTAVLLAGWSAAIAILAAYLYSRKLMNDTTDLMKGLQSHVETFTGR